MYENYLQCDTTDAEVIETIKAKIADEEGFSLVRFGDGDIPLIQEPLLKPAIRIDPAIVERQKQNMCKHWGYRYPKECERLREDVFKIFRFGIQHSDMIGLLDVNDKRNIATFNLKSPEKQLLLKKASLARETARILGYQQGKQRICDHYVVRRRALGNIKSVKNILQGRPVHIMSMWVKELKENKMAELLCAKVTYTNFRDTETLRRLQGRLHEFRRIKEKVILFGGGGGGKNIGAFLKMENSAVCIDMGATLDAWAGSAARPHMRGNEVHAHLVINRRKKVLKYR